MKKIKAKSKARITVEVTDGVKKDFDVKCAKIGETKRAVLTHLMYMWYKGQIKIPGEK